MNNNPTGKSAGNPPSPSSQPTNGTNSNGSNPRKNAANNLSQHGGAAAEPPNITRMTTPSPDPSLPALETLDAKTLQASLEGGDTPASVDLLKQVMKTNPPQDDERKHRYTELLLDFALQERDAEAAQIAAAQMDTDPALDAALWSRLESALATQPDAVYVFIRARMGASPTVNTEPSALDERWLERLRAAGWAALQVAISDSDAETAMDWFKLVAREPVYYGLSDILYRGLLAARERAINEPLLARGVMTLAIRRNHEAANQFLADDALMNALPNNLGRTFRDAQGDALALQQTHGAEVFSVALARAARRAMPDLFTTAVIETVWALYQGTTSQTIPHFLPDHTPGDIVSEWLQTGASWLPDPAIRMFMTLMARDRRDELFLALAGRLGGQDRQLAILANSLITSERSVNDIMSLIAQLIAVGDLTVQDAVDLDVLLLTAWEWSKNALPIMLQIARTAQAHPNVSASADVWWRLLEIAEAEREETIARVALRRLTADFDDNELNSPADDGALTESLLRLMPLATWSAAQRNALMVWWRGFVREQPQARLQRLDKLFDGKRTLDDLRAVLGTVIAFRKMIGKKSLKDFLVDIDTTFRVLQALSESFDPSPRRTLVFDPAAIREELDARGSELSESELKILANTLKELANLIGTLGDNRSKASLMRRGEDIDRQLTTGEQPPHSAIDTFKWIAGYLSGAHTNADDAES